MSFKSMINNPRYSDVQLVTADGHKLYGHKNILAVRCPQLIQVIFIITMNLLELGLCD